jgi:hypothetical protein
MQSISPFSVQKCLLLAATLAVGAPLWCGLAAATSASSGAMSVSSPGPVQSKQTAQEPPVALPQRAGYLAENATFLGTIYHAMGEPSFLRSGDLALIDVGSNHHLKAGEQLVVYRILDRVRHPHTSATAGHPIRMLGAATAIRVEDKIAMIRVTLASTN